MRQIRAFALLFFLVGLPIAAAAAAVYFRNDARLKPLEQESLQTVLAQTREHHDPLAVSVHVALAEPKVITSPFHGGVVSASYVSAGDEIAHGDRVLQIDGIDRLAIKSSVPFWRDLSLGDMGEDVAALQAFLLKKGVLDLDGEEPEGQYGQATAAAVRQLSLDLGYSSSTPDMHSDWFLWMPEFSIVVSDIWFSVGSPPPPAGSTLLSSTQSVVDARILGADGQPVLRNDGLPRTLQLGDVELAAVVVDGMVVIEAPEFLDAALVDDQMALRGALRLRTPVHLVTLPASAVITGVSGATCVLIGASPDRNVVRTVEVVSSSGNQAEMATGKIRESEPVVVNPRVALPGVGCS
ncbi:MAG: hypothetical protein KTU85_04880 [Acidimicrobiia bacterium]|nr:hypothetical protein [Acidimicrobiia bacterium]MCY4457554.1 hypothetical protein [Acidimicrobiaceae bacterium]